jgi:hypothetical protein
VSMKNLLQRATAAATELCPQACAYLEPCAGETRIARRLRAALPGRDFREVLRNGDVK